MIPLLPTKPPVSFLALSFSDGSTKCQTPRASILHIGPHSLPFYLTPYRCLLSQPLVLILFLLPPSTSPPSPEPLLVPACLPLFLPVLPSGFPLYPPPPPPSPVHPFAAAQIPHPLQWLLQTPTLLSSLHICSSRSLKKRKESYSRERHILMFSVKILPLKPFNSVESSKQIVSASFFQFLISSDHIPIFPQLCSSTLVSLFLSLSPTVFS